MTSSFVRTWLLPHLLRWNRVESGGAARASGMPRLAGPRCVDPTSQDQPRVGSWSSYMDKSNPGTSQIPRNEALLYKGVSVPKYLAVWKVDQ